MTQFSINVVARRKGTELVRSKEMGKNQPRLALSSSFFSSKLSLLKGSLSPLLKRLAFSFKETGQINPGPGAGLWSALHCVRVPAPLLPGARLGGPDAL